MKYDLSKPPTRGARRTLDAFYLALIDALARKSFEEVAVNTLCDAADYPRATFYNYFDDKYDLLNYAWWRVAERVGFDHLEEVAPDDVLPTFFNRFYDLAEQHLDLIGSLSHLNPPEGYLWSSFRIYLGKQVRSVFDRCHTAGLHNYPIPYELVSEQAANTVMLVLEWTFLRGQDVTRKQALDYLEYLLGGMGLTRQEAPSR